MKWVSRFQLQPKEGLLLAAIEGVAGMAVAMVEIIETTDTQVRGVHLGTEAEEDQEATDLADAGMVDVAAETVAGGATIVNLWTPT